jgi:acetyl esterase/lipase
MLPFTKPFLDRGYTVCAVRHGSSPKYLIPEIVADVRTALEHVTDHAGEYHIDRNRLGIFGFSAGGHLSLMLGTTTNAAARGRDDKPRVAAVAAVFPPTDLTPYLDPAAGYLEKFPALKFPREKGDSYSPLKQVSDDDAPSLMVHGDKDELVPLWHSEKIRDALRASDVAADLVVIEGAGHYTYSDACAFAPTFEDCEAPFLAPEVAHVLINTLSVGFLDLHLGHDEAAAYLPPGDPLLTWQEVP